MTDKPIIGGDMVPMNEYNDRPFRKPGGKVWFLNGDLVRVYHRSRGQGVITLYNINEDCLQTILVEEWFKKRRRAYNMKSSAELVNRNRKYLPVLVKKGIIPPPVGAARDRKPAWQVMSYYSEDQIREIRDILAGIQWGRPRNDGLITNNFTPTVQELTRRFGDGILTYTKTEDGRVIPVWDETL